MEKYIKKIKKTLEKNENVIFAYLYGSYSRGRSHKYSDIDIAVFLKKHDTNAYMEILSQIPTDFMREVDIRVLNDAPSLFKYKIIREGTLLFVKDPEVLKKFVYSTLITALEVKKEIERIREKRFKRILYARWHSVRSIKNIRGT